MFQFPIKSDWGGGQNVKGTKFCQQLYHSVIIHKNDTAGCANLQNDMLLGTLFLYTRVYIHN